MNHPHDRTPAVGVLLVNLGSPSEPSPRAIRRYLRQFLSDRRVIELPRLLWLSILYCFVLPLRPRRIARNYRRIWLDRGSPLAVHTADLAAGVKEKLADCPGPVVVDWAMSYGEPAIGPRLEALRQRGVEQLIVLPLYPQYSGTTTAAVFDQVTRHLQSWRWVPALRFINAYHDAPAYIAALAASVRAHRDAHGDAGHLLMSFHGLPVRYVEQGDPYFCHAHKTARLLAEALHLSENRYSVSFQSQFGKAQWVGPGTTQRLQALARAGQTSVDVICPGFSADCIETLDEIEVENAEAFRNAGGADLRYIPALNGSDAHVDCMASLITQAASGWWQLDASAPRADRPPQRAQRMRLDGR